MVNQLKVNGKLQDVIITKNYKENELFKKLNKKRLNVLVCGMHIGSSLISDTVGSMHNKVLSENKR